MHSLQSCLPTRSACLRQANGVRLLKCTTRGKREGEGERYRQRTTALCFTNVCGPSWQHPFSFISNQGGKLKRIIKWKSVQSICKLSKELLYHSIINRLMTSLKGIFMQKTRPKYCLLSSFWLIQARVSWPPYKVSRKSAGNISCAIWK